MATLLWMSTNRFGKQFWIKNVMVTKKLQIGESELDLEDEESEEELEDEMDDGWGDREFVSDISGDEDDFSDIVDSVSPLFDRNILP